jgi:UPF0716 protein FxsA
VALVLVLLFLVLPFAELAVIVAAAGSFGLAPTFLVLVGLSVLGGWLMRREGWSVWRRANDQLASGRIPTRELLDGMLVMFGGALLLTPGFITDAVGLLLILPPTRAVLRPWLLRRLQARVQSATVVMGAGAGFPAAGFGGSGFPSRAWASGVDGRGPTVDTTGTEAPGPSPSARVVRVEVDRPDALGPGR